MFIVRALATVSVFDVGVSFQKGRKGNARERDQRSTLEAVAKQRTAHTAGADPIGQIDFGSLRRWRVVRSYLLRIAILEDDPRLAAHVVRLMEQVGHDAFLFHTGTAALEGLSQHPHDLILLDWALPDINGLEVLAWLLSNLDPSPPVIMVTARADASDIVAGLAAGADDYISKPIQDEILKARVAAILRRTYDGVGKSDVQNYGQYVLDKKRRTVSFDGTAIETTDKEFALALLLFQNLDRSLSRDYIMATVWKAAPNTLSRTLDAHVSQIRGRLGFRPENGLRLSSIYSYGYRLETIGSE